MLEILGQLQILILQSLAGVEWEQIDKCIKLRITQLFQGFKKQLEETDFRFGSPIGNLAGELSHTHPLFREKLAELFQGWRRSVQQLLESSDPSIPAHVDAELVSSYVLSVLQGCVGQARVMRDVGPIEQAERLLVEQLPTLLGHNS